MAFPLALIGLCDYFVLILDALRCSSIPASFYIFAREGDRVRLQDHKYLFLEMFLTNMSKKTAMEEVTVVLFLAGADLNSQREHTLFFFQNKVEIF